MNSKRFKQLILLIIVALTIYGCAKEMYPEGGKKDVTPAKALLAKPQFYSTNFREKKIIIRFNEFLQLVNKQKIIISPPLNKPLEVDLKGKNVIIKITDTLRSNTTYNINFQDVIRDFTEGNITENFQYIFSTGNEIDTIFVEGVVYEANTGNPAQNIQVGLYFSDEDSVVVKQKPDYYTITNKEGYFCINNIKSADYKIFALKDNSNDMLFNKPEELVAFRNERIKPEVQYETFFDTLKIISNINIEKGDTLFTDSIVEKTIIVSTLGQIDMYLFEHDHKKQFIKTYTRRERHKVEVVFNRQPFGNSNVFISDTLTLIPFPSQRPDSLLFFVPNSEIAKRDTLIVFCEYLIKDSIDELISKIDTLKFMVEKKVTVEDTLLSIKSNATGGKLEIDQQFQLLFNHPVIEFDSTLVGLFLLVDTLKKPLPLVIDWDSTNTVLTIKYKYQQEKQYEFLIDSLAFTDIYGYQSLPQSFKFLLSDETNYGVLTIVMMDDYDELSIFELTTKSKEVVWKKEYPKDKIFTINNLKPGSYTLYLYIDRNENRKRDTGSYFDGILPEYVVPYQKEITIKANWDTEIEWKIGNKKISVNEK